MKKIIFFLLQIMVVLPLCYSQTLPQALPALTQGWQRIYLKDVGSFDLPPTMEVQKGKYKEFVDEMKRIKGIDASQITAQPIGLNEKTKEGFEKYARVMVETKIGSPNDFEKLNFNISAIQQSEISELNTVFKQQVQQGFLGTGLKVTEWYPLKIEKINGMSCIHISYKRQLNDKPYVLVNIYMFQNFDRRHIFTLSYRLSEAEYWKENFASILKSFRISNIN